MSIDPAWVSVGALALVILKDVFGFGRKSSTYLTKAEHESICEKNQKAIREDLQEIKEDQRKEAESSRTFRQSLAEKLTSMEVKLALAVERAKRPRP